MIFFYIFHDGTKHEKIIILNIFMLSQVLFIGSNRSLYIYIYIYIYIMQEEKIIYLLQVKLADVWQVPFHLLGGGPNPLSLKLADSGQIPVSSIPTIISLSVVFL